MSRCLFFLALFALATSVRAADLDVATIRTLLAEQGTAHRELLVDALVDVERALTRAELSGDASAGEVLELRELAIGLHERLAILALDEGDEKRHAFHVERLARLDPTRLPADDGGAGEGPALLELTPAERLVPPRPLAIRGSPFRIYADLRGDYEGVSILFCPEGDCAQRTFVEGSPVVRDMKRAPVLGLAERAVDASGVWARSGIYEVELLPADFDRLGFFTYRVHLRSQEAGVTLPDVKVLVLDTVDDEVPSDALSPRAMAQLESYRTIRREWGSTDLPEGVEAVDTDSMVVFRRDMVTIQNSKGLFR